MKSLLAFPLLFSVVYAARINRYKRYEATKFFKNQNEDVDEIIKGYFEDLRLIISDLNQLETIAFPFSRISENLVVFQYKPAEPVYQLQSNHYLRLYPQPKMSGPVTFFFRPESGDCSGLSLFRKNWFFKTKTAFASEPKLRLTVTAEMVALHINRRLLQEEFGWENTFYLYVPDKCVLYLTSVTRYVRGYKLSLSERKLPLLKYSHRNNRPAELIGLVSKKIQNFSPFRYLPDLKAFGFLQLQSFSDGLATFSADLPQNIKKPYVIPQNIAIDFDRRFTPEPFPQDTVQLLVRKSDLEACREFESSDEMVVEATFELNSVLSTPVDCELYLIRATRTVQPIPHSQCERALRYSGPSDLAALHMRHSRIHLFPHNHNYIESLDHLPRLERIGYHHPGSMVFRKFVRSTILPKNVPLRVHTAGPVVFQRDVVRLSFVNRPFCQINLYKIPANSETKEPMERNRGFELKRFTTGFEQMKIIYDRTALNENFPEGTKFVFQSSCALYFTKISRKIFDDHSNMPHDMLLPIA